MPTDPSSARRRVWQDPPLSWLFSIRAGVILLAVVAIASIAGTMIEDLAEAQRMVYYSLWYRMLLLLLAVNIACATFRTIVEKILPARHVQYQTRPRFYAGLTPSAEVAFDGDAAEVEEAFRRRGFRVWAQGDAGFALKGMLGRWGAPVSHIGFVMVLLGAFASAWTSREGSVRVVEGEATTSMTVWTQPPMEEQLGFILQVDDFTVDFFPNTNPPVPSSFISTVSIYSLQGEHEVTQPVEVNRSLLAHEWTLHQTGYGEVQGKERMILAVGNQDRKTTASVEISPGQQRAIPQMPGYEILLSAQRPRRWTIFESAAAVSGSGTLSGAAGAAGIVLVAERFEPDLVIGSDQITSRSDQLNNPAVLVSVYEKGELAGRQWLFARADLKAMMHREGSPYELDLLRVSGQAPEYQFSISVRPAGSAAPPDEVTVGLGEEHAVGEPSATAPMQPAAQDPGPWNVRFERAVPAYFTDLTLTRNAAIPFIYWGCTVMMLGLLIVFCIPRKEVWFAVDRENKRLRIAAIYRQPQEEFDWLTRKVLHQFAKK